MVSDNVTYICPHPGFQESRHIAQSTRTKKNKSQTPLLMLIVNYFVTKHFLLTALLITGYISKSRLKFKRFGFGWFIIVVLCL